MWVIWKHLFQLEIEVLCCLVCLIRGIVLNYQLATLFDRHPARALLNKKGKEANNDLRQPKIVKLYVGDVVAVDGLPLQVLLLNEQVRVELEVHLLIYERLDVRRNMAIAEHVFLVVVEIFVAISALLTFGLVCVFAVVELIVPILLLEVKYITQKRLDLFIRLFLLHDLSVSLGLLHVLQDDFVF